MPTAQKVLVIGAVSFTVLLIAVSAGAASEESSSDEPATTANPASPALPLATAKAAKPPATAVWPPANQQASGASQPLQPILAPNPKEHSNINRQSATREPTEVTRPLHTYEVFHHTRNNEDYHGISIYIEENEDLTDGDLYRIALAEYQKAQELGKSEGLLGTVYPRWDYFVDFYSDREIAGNSTCFEEPNEFGFSAPCGGTFASDHSSYLGNSAFLDGSRVMIRTFFTKSELTKSLSQWSTNSGPLDLEPLLQEDLNNIRKVVYIIEPETDMCAIAQQVSLEHDGSREAVHIYFLPEDNRHAYELLAKDQSFLNSVNDHTAASIQIRLEPSTISANGPKTWTWSFRKVEGKWDNQNQHPVCQGGEQETRTAAVTPPSRQEEREDTGEQPDNPTPIPKPNPTPPIVAVETAASKDSTVTLTVLSAARGHTCGLRQDGQALCWGADGSGQSTPPRGMFAAIAAGHSYTCGLRQDGQAVCWGADTRGESNAPSGAFAAITTGWNHTCGLRQDGQAVCWGADDRGQSSPPDGAFTAITAGERHTCGLRSDGQAVCWGWNIVGQSSPTDGAFTAITAGVEHNCGLRGNGHAVCWGANRFGQSSPPGGAFTAITAGQYHTCGLRGDGQAVCWGAENAGHFPLGLSFGQTHPPDGAFTAITAGDFHTCGLRQDGQAVCWGWNKNRQSNPPD